MGVQKRNFKMSNYNSNLHSMTMCKCESDALGSYCLFREPIKSRFFQGIILYNTRTSQNKAKEVMWGEIIEICCRAKP